MSERNVKWVNNDRERERESCALRACAVCVCFALLLGTKIDMKRIIKTELKENAENGERER